MVVVLAAGCTSGLTQLQRGKALDRGQFEVNAGVTWPVSGRAARSVIDAEAEISKRVEQSESGELTESDARGLTQIAAAVLLFMPVPNSELSVRGGVGWDVDLGLRLSGPRRQLDVKWQGLHAKRHGVDLALSLAVATHSNPAPSIWEKAVDVAQSLQILDFSRRDFTASIIASRDVGHWFSLWVALAWSRSAISIGSELVNQAADIGVDASALAVDATMQQTGAQFGFRVGYRYVFFLIEFSFAYAHFQPMILGEQVDLSGWTIAPSAALQVTF